MTEAPIQLDPAIVEAAQRDIGTLERLVYLLRFDLARYRGHPHEVTATGLVMAVLRIENQASRIRRALQQQIIVGNGAS